MSVAPNRLIPYNRARAPKGYRLEDFDDAFARYLPAKVAQAAQPKTSKPKEPGSRANWRQLRDLPAPEIPQTNPSARPARLPTSSPEPPTAPESEIDSADDPVPAEFHFPEHNLNGEAANLHDLDALVASGVAQYVEQPEA